ncbi:MAG: hypothetical protein LBL92_01975 [Propionibacteriaceae bacterium]|jgi:hypothetical protein|nr:hypothetical protein [Propionibacteriaceae bacterium]
MSESAPDEPQWPTYPEPATSGFYDPGAEAADPPPEPGQQLVNPGSADPIRPPVVPQYVPPGYTPDDPLNFTGSGSSLVKEGRWMIPPYLALQGSFGSIRLDCQLATPTTPVIHIEVSGAFGDTVIIVPPGWAADLNRLRAGFGERKVKVDETPAAGCPILVFSGQLNFGSFTIRYPNRRDQRHLRRWLDKNEPAGTELPGPELLLGPGLR